MESDKTVIVTGLMEGTLEQYLYEVRWTCLRCACAPLQSITPVHQAQSHSVGILLGVAHLARPPESPLKCF